MKVSTDKAKIDALLSRRVVEAVVEKDLRARLFSGTQLRVKLGFDPTAPDIHLGHTMTLRKLKEFQDLGHQIVLIVGDYTTRVGDPTGKSKTRPMLDEKEIEKNAKTYLAQIGKILDIDKVIVRRNSEWFGKMSFADIIVLMSKFTVARMIERDDFEKRMENGVDVHMHELLYPMMQGYDSVMIDADVEIGGTDQRFNILTGRELQKKMGKRPQEAMFIGPILVGTDGTQKMSKSLGNHIGIDESPEEMFGKVMSIPDSALWDYFTLVTDVAEEEIAEMRKACEKGKMNPRDAKVRLGKEIVAMYHSASAADDAEAHFVKVFAKKGVPDEIPEHTMPAGSHTIVDVLVDAGLASSKSDARRTVGQGGVKVAGEVVKDIAFEVRIVEEATLIQKGKRHFVNVRAA